MCKPSSLSSCKFDREIDKIPKMGELGTQAALLFSYLFWHLCTESQRATLHDPDLLAMILYCTTGCCSRPQWSPLWFSPGRFHGSTQVLAGVGHGGGHHFPSHGQPWFFLAVLKISKDRSCAFFWAAGFSAAWWKPGRKLPIPFQSADVEEIL